METWLTLSCIGLFYSGNIKSFKEGFFKIVFWDVKNCSNANDRYNKLMEVFIVPYDTSY